MIATWKMKRVMQVKTLNNKKLKKLSKKSQ